MMPDAYRRRLLPIGALLLIGFEIANVYFVMPLPGSQRMRSVTWAHTLWTARWLVRGLALLLMAGSAAAGWRSVRWRWTVAMPLLLLSATAGVVAQRVSADRLFRQPTVMRITDAAANGVAEERLVVGVEVNGVARAYPLPVIGYHHHLIDSLGGVELLVTYCTVCRTGRVYRPVIDGVPQRFRLVGMDHFNAMLEDVATGSWWRQANGEAVVGDRRGRRLPEVPSRQMTLRQWLALHPTSGVLQPDPAFAAEYAALEAYERGRSRGALTGTDPRSWHDKSWVVGITIRGQSRAYDWNDLTQR